MKKLFVIIFIACAMVPKSMSWGQSVPTNSRVSSVRERIETDLRHDMAERSLMWGNAIYIRIFKESSELELWVAKEDTFTLFRTYPICRWSGALGPKTAQGDNQCPEGFYFVTSGRLNPSSQFHLSFNLGYPNTYERAQGWTGSALMVHGNCVSIGCYAMTDPGIEEIYLLADAALQSGQPYFRVHAFPFRMTAERLADASDLRWFSFWQNLKDGYDYFERRKRPPNVVVRNGQYMFEDESRQSLMNRVRDDIAADKDIVITSYVGLWSEHNDNPALNLYWGALYGHDALFDRSNELEQRLPFLTTHHYETLSEESFETDPVVMKVMRSRARRPESDINERSRVVVIYLVYKDMENATYDMGVQLKTGRLSEETEKNSRISKLLSQSYIIGYWGHNIYYGGFSVDDLENLAKTISDEPRGVFMIGCQTSRWFPNKLITNGIEPLCFTTTNMAPEAYIAVALYDGILQGLSKATINRNIANAYKVYQRLSRAPSSLFISDEQRIIDRLEVDISD